MNSKPSSARGSSYAQYFPWLFFSLGSVFFAWVTWNRSNFSMSDSFQYMQSGINLVTGHGYRDVSGNFLNFFPPLYPIAIGLVHVIIPDAETAARVVSVGGSVLVMTAVWRLFSFRRDWRVAFLASTLFLLLPLRVASSQWILSESLYLGFLLWGFALLFTQNQVRLWNCFMAGLLLGLAYLTRPEVLWFLAACFLWLVLLNVTRAGFEIHFSKGIISGLFLVLGFALLAAPYHVWLYGESGEWFASSRFAAAEAVAQVCFENRATGSVFSTQLNDTGTAVELKNVDTAHGLILDRYFFNAGNLLRRLFYLAGPSWIAPLLVFIGLFFLLVKRTSVLQSQYVWQVILSSVVLTMPIYCMADRNLLQVMPAICLWIAVAAFEVPVWMKQFRTLDGRTVRIVATVLGMLFVLVLGSYGYRLFTSQGNALDVSLAKNAAQWMKENQLASGPVLSQEPTLAFYSENTQIWLTSDSVRKILNYAKANRVRYIYVTTMDIKTELRELLLNGDEQDLPPGLVILHEFFFDENKAVLAEFVSD